MVALDPGDDHRTGRPESRVRVARIDLHLFVGGGDQLLAEDRGLDGVEAQALKNGLDLLGIHGVEGREMLACQDGDNRLVARQELAHAVEVAARDVAHVAALDDADAALHAARLDDLRTAVHHAHRLRGTVANTAPAGTAVGGVSGNQKVRRRVKRALSAGFISPIDLGQAPSSDSSDYPRPPSISCSPKRRSASRSGSPSPYMTIACPMATETNPKRYIASH